MKWRTRYFQRKKINLGPANNLKVENVWQNVKKWSWCTPERRYFALLLPFAFKNWVAVIKKKSMYIRGFTKFGIKVLWRLQFLEYLRTLSLKFQKARTKIEVVLTLPCWLSQLNWDSQQGRARTTSILVRAFWNF